MSIESLASPRYQRARPSATKYTGLGRRPLLRRPSTAFARPTHTSLALIPYMPCLAHDIVIDRHRRPYDLSECRPLARTRLRVGPAGGRPYGGPAGPTAIGPAVVTAVAIAQQL